MVETLSRRLMQFGGGDCGEGGGGGGGGGVTYIM